MTDPTPVPDTRLLTAAARLAVRYDGTFAPETIQRLLADSYQRLAEHASVPTHLVLLAERLAHERLDALAYTQALKHSTTPRVLFVCSGNAGRSQLAAGLLAHLGGEAVHVSSAGTRPAPQLDPHVVEVLAEAGIPLAREAYPKPLTEEVVAAADVVVTMGCGDACPLSAGRRYLDWPVPDPDGATVERVRAIRDEIAARVQALLADLTAQQQ